MSPESSENFPIISEPIIKKEHVHVIKKRKKMPDLMPIRPNVVIKSEHLAKHEISKLEINKVTINWLN